MITVIALFDHLHGTMMSV